MGNGDEQFGDYELRQRVAVGGMAEIFLARRSRPGGFSKVVAVKRVLPELAKQEEFRKMFADEARLCASLNHPNLVQVFDYGEVDGVPFLVMEWVDGCDLSSLLREGGPLRPSVAAFAMAEVARALAHVHAAKDESGRSLHIVHRDLSPGNVLISRAGDVKLGDFGVAQARGRLARTDAGRLKGTLAYLSPEQVSGVKVDQRTDIYAVGLLLFELLTGERYVAGDSEVELLQAAMAPPERTASSLEPDLDRAFDDLLELALAQEPEARHSDAELLERELRKLCSDSSEARGLLSKRVGEALGDCGERRRTDVMCAEPPPMGERVALFFRRLGSNRIRLALVIFLILGIFSGGFLLLRSIGSSEDGLAISTTEDLGEGASDTTPEARAAVEPPSTPLAVEDASVADTGETTGDTGPVEEAPLPEEAEEVDSGPEGVRPRPTPTPRHERSLRPSQPAAPTPNAGTEDPSESPPTSPGEEVRDDPPTPPVPVVEGPSPRELLREADRLRGSRGIRPGDDREADQLRSRAASLVSGGGSPAEARGALEAYRQRVREISIDQAFIDRKMRRATSRIQAAQPTGERAAQLDTLSQQALRNAMGRDFDGANRTLNRIFDLLR